MEVSPNVYLLELFLNERGAKNCRKASFRKNFKNKINPTCLEQNNLRRTLKQMLPSEMREIEDNYFGVDYQYCGVKIDQKFSFGALGENTIKIRVQNRRLLNKSDWTMIINRDNKIEFFPTRKLEAFVRKNWGLVQKRLVERKEFHSEYAVKLEELYKLEEVNPVRAELAEEALIEGLGEITKLNHCEGIIHPDFIPKPENVENERIPHGAPHLMPELMPKTK